MAFGDAGIVVASAARTTTGSSTAIACEKGLNLNLLVEVTASSGTTPTLDFTVDWSMDGTNFGVSQPADSFTQIVTSVRAIKQFPVKGPFFRLSWAITGTTPSFTFQVSRFVTA